jgi:ABC-type polysaccharide/polyol phosphate transport system ATPase subunit
VISLSASEQPVPAPQDSVPAPQDSEAPPAQPERPEPPHPRQKPAPGEPPTVSVKDVSITYRTTFEKIPTLRSAIVRLGRGERAVREVKAVRNASFDVPRGTSLGIIGANGAGKSTLMRAIAGVLPPTSGRIEVRGRISSLLALGVGFNAQLSGRENVVLGGLAAGLSRKEVEARADEVAEFAELGDFMEMPLRTYSAGMGARLAFSVSVHMDPDILLIDEALSAGDAAFKVKASQKMDDLMSSARAMFLVSHSMASIEQLCTDCIWMHKGQVMMHDTPQKCIEAYTNFLQVGEEALALDDL